MVSKDSIGIDKDLTKDRNLNTFKMYCKRRKSSPRFPDRKARSRLYACHCIAGNVSLQNCCDSRQSPSSVFPPVQTNHMQLLAMVGLVVIPDVVFHAVASAKMSGVSHGG